jgi:transposase
MDSNIKGNEAQMRDAVAATTTTLPQVHGISTVLTAKLLGHVGDISRFPSADHFASYTGTSPLAASSGRRFGIDSTPAGIVN